MPTFIIISVDSAHLKCVRFVIVVVVVDVVVAVWLYLFNKTFKHKFV